MMFPSFRTARIGVATALALAAFALPAQAAGERVIPPQQSWSFSGPFGKFDRAQLQRGFKVAREVRFHLALCLDHESQTEPVAQPAGNQPQAECTGIPQRVEQ